MKKFISFLIAGLFSLSSTQAQVVTVDPAFPTQNDTITVTFDATKGNGALTGFVPVYAHTGVITQAGGAGSWQHVQGNWGTADPNVVMNFAGNNKHTITYHIPTFYGYPSGTTVNELAFVFRDAQGNNVGRAADGSDIFYPIYPANAGFLGRIISPAQSQILTSGANLTVKAATNQDASIDIYDNGVLKQSASNAQSITATFAAGGAGNHLVEMVANNGTTTVRDTFNYVVNSSVQTAPAPSGTELGINYISNTSVVLMLHAPFKNNIYVIGDFNNWQPDTAYFMNKTPSGNNWWVQIDGLTPGQQYGFQYLIDGNMRIAEPYSELILDPWNDGFIDPQTYPNLPAYPTGQTTGIISIMQTDKPQYNWKNPNFQAPAKDELIVYELLVRDFVAAHNYQTLIDTLDYLSRLGVNAIELMPVNEFEGNESWGYNPSFHMALDKYYGTSLKFKEFIDSCHSRGIAVILDIVLNHAFGQSPLVQMYFDPNAGQYGQPTSNNPWFNETPRHDFNVGYDFNHESQATQDFVKKIVQYWLEEYKVDGYRFDLSKGFTQNNTLGNIGAWNAYDQSRINILNRIKTECEQINPNAYMILEHFADNSEESVLSNDGFLIWGNMHYNYGEAAMGWLNNSNFDGAFHSSRGHTYKHLVAYAESHDEERMMRMMLDYGNSSGNYSTKTLSTALGRMELLSAFLYTIPGPKMLWQFGELGYEVGINDPCRVCNKPIRWNYLNNPDRKRLYEVTSDIINMRRTYPVFNSNNYRYDLGGATKRINLDGNVNATVIGNFDVVQQNADPNFQNTGWWYDYLSGDSINVSNVNAGIPLQPGEYRIYTSQKLEVAGPIGTTEENLFASGFSLYPNPTNGNLVFSYTFDGKKNVRAQIINASGMQVMHLGEHSANGASTVEYDISALKPGVYFIKVMLGEELITERIVKY